MTMEKGSAFEWWMISNLAFGAGFSAFISLLIPPYVTGVTGNSADAGIVMAIISLAAVLGPVLGGFADKYRAHRVVLTLGVVGMAFGFLMYSISAEAQALLALDAIALGVSIAAINAVGPVFIVGAGLSRSLQAKRLTVFNLLAPIGQVIGGALMAVAVTSGLGFSERFLIAAGVMVLASIVTWFSSANPAKRIILEENKPEEHHEQKKRSFSIKRILFSTFGMFLIILVLSSLGNNGINAQIANILPNVYGIEQATTSALISAAGLLNIVFFLIAGAWMARSGALPGFTAGNIMRLVGSSGMAVLGLITGSPVLLVAGFVLLFYQGNPFVRLAQPVLAIRFSSISPGQATGWVIAAAASGSFLGSLIGGFLADSVGYNAINWMATISIGLSVLLIFVVLWTAERKKRAQEKQQKQFTTKV